MKIIDLENKTPYDVSFTKNSGEEELLCPRCSHARKIENQKLKCFRWNHDKEAGFCHNCQTSFVIPKDYRKRKDYAVPEWKNNTELSDRLVKWFEGRGISQFTLRQMKVTEGPEWMPQAGRKVNTVQFNYFRDGALVNVKYRTGNKHFKLYKDAELVFYNLDAIADTPGVVIVEGEIDALSFYEAGIHNVVSVPNGASTVKNKLEYLDNCIDYFDNKAEIILAGDNDLPGVALRNELAARLGVEKCYKVNFRECKDANEYLQKYGKEGLARVIAEKHPFPVTGIFTTTDLIDDLRLLYRQGLNKGLTVGEPIDEFLSFERGRLYTITGAPGHGKSEWVDHWLVKLNIMHGVKVGYFSPENFPIQLHQSKIVSKITGSEFSQSRLPQSEFDEAVDYMAGNFYWVMPEEDFTVERILEKARYLVFKKGISVFVIDPYNKLEHTFSRGESETIYISRFLDQLVNFCHKNNVSMFLIAHPRKMAKDKTTGMMDVPNMYDINGSANFYNKTDFGISIYRNFVARIENDREFIDSSCTTVHIQKTKFKHLGGVGSVDFTYNWRNGRYEQNGTPENAFDTNNWLKTPARQKQMTPELEFFDNGGEEAPF